MKLLFDQNISHRILRLLPEQFKNSTHVKTENLINFPDIQIWEYAKKNGYVIVTQDSDFNELNSLHGYPPKIIWIRTGNLSTTTILEILMDHYKEIEKFVKDNNYGCFEIIRIKQK